jgi:hypothetical protein
VGRGVDEWDNYNLSDDVLGAEEDKGDVLVIKSGTDFRDISEICLELKDSSEGSIRKKLINKVTGKRIPYRALEDFKACPCLGKRHQIDPGLRSCEKLRKILDNILESVGASLRAPLCQLAAELDVRSHLIRTQEVRLSDSRLVTRHELPSSLPAQTGLRISCDIHMMMHYARRVSKVVWTEFSYALACCGEILCTGLVWSSLKSQIWMDSSILTGRIHDTWGCSRDSSVRGPLGGLRNQRENIMGDVRSIFVYLARSGGVSASPFIP